MPLVSCIDCGAQVEAQRRSKRYCSTCALIHLKAQKQRYADSLEGKAASRRATAKWLSSEKGGAYFRGHYLSEHGQELGRKRQAIHRLKPETKIREANYQRARYKTPHGRAMMLAAVARRKGNLGPNYATVAELISLGLAYCYQCGARAREVDHVLPLSFALVLGLTTEVDSYVAPICKRCHLAKTKYDIRDVRRIRKYVSMADS